MNSIDSIEKCFERDFHYLILPFSKQKVLQKIVYRNCYSIASESFEVKVRKTLQNNISDYA